MQNHHRFCGRDISWQQIRLVTHIFVFHGHSTEMCRAIYILRADGLRRSSCHEELSRAVAPCDRVIARWYVRHRILCPPVSLRAETPQDWHENFHIMVHLCAIEVVLIHKSRAAFDIAKTLSRETKCVRGW